MKFSEANGGVEGHFPEENYLGLIVWEKLSSGELFRSNCPEGRSPGDNCLGGNFTGETVRGAVVQGEII